MDAGLRLWAFQKIVGRAGCQNKELFKNKQNSWPRNDFLGMIISKSFDNKNFG